MIRFCQIKKVCVTRKSAYFAKKLSKKNQRDRFKGKYNLFKLELTKIIILRALNGGLGSSVAREGSCLGGLI